MESCYTEKEKKEDNMEEKIDQAKVRELARNLMFDLSDEEAQNVAEEFTVFQKQLEFLRQIDTEGVEPMVYPFEQETTYMREDEVSSVISRQDALSNVKRTRKGYVTLPRVVK